MGSSTKGTLKFIVFSSETTFKDKAKVSNFVEPVVTVEYGKHTIKGIYGNSFEAKQEVKKSGEDKVEHDEAKGIYRQAINQIFTMKVDPLQRSLKLVYRTTPEKNSLLGEGQLIGEETVDIKDFAKDLMKKKQVSLKPATLWDIQSLKMNVLVQFKEEIEEKITHEQYSKNLEM